MEQSRGRIGSRSKGPQVYGTHLKLSVSELLANFLNEQLRLTYGCDGCGDCNDGFLKDPDWFDFVFLTPSIADIFWVELTVKKLKHVPFTWGNDYSNMKALPVQMINNNSQSYKHEVKKATKCCHPDSFSIVCPSGWPEIRQILISVDLLWPFMTFFGLPFWPLK